MVAITAMTQSGPPAVNAPGSQQRSHEVTWTGETDEVATADEIIALAQGLVQPLPAGVNPVPVKGDVLATDRARVVVGLRADTTLDDTIKQANGLTARENDLAIRVAAFVNADPNNRHADGGAVALDISCNERGEGGWTKHFELTAVYRAPQAGLLERSGFLENFRTGLTFPTAPAWPTEEQVKTTGRVSPDSDTIITALDPLNQPAEISVTYQTESAEQAYVYPVTRGPTGALVVGSLNPGIVAQPTFNLRNPLGELLPFRETVQYQQIITVTRVVADDTFAFMMNDRFHNTTNFDFIPGPSGSRIPPYYCRFLNAETSRAVIEGKSYKVLAYRVLVNWQAYIEFEGATGSYYLVRPEGPATQGGTLPDLVPEIQKDNEGFPIVTRYPLTATGELAEKPEDQLQIPYCRYRPEKYTNMLVGS